MSRVQRKEEGLSVFERRTNRLEGGPEEMAWGGKVARNWSGVTEDLFPALRKKKSNAREGHRRM